MKILTCNSNRPLAEAISAYLGLSLTRASVRRFSDMEVFVEIHENVRGEDVFVVIPTDNLYAEPVLVKDIQENHSGQDLVMVSPDVGGVFRTRQIARRVDADLAIIDKRRERAGVSEVMNIIGDVAGRRCILVDDIVDSAGTLCNAAEALSRAGATSVSAYVTHGVLSGGAVARVVSSPLDSLVTTDSILATEAVRVSRNIRQLTIAPLMAEAIQRISEERS